MTSLSNRCPKAISSSKHIERPGRYKCQPPLALQGPPTQKDQRPPLSRLAGVALTTIEGIAEGPALVILRESGTDLHQWPRVQHGCRWLGRCPQHQISGGKGLSRRVRPGAPRVTVAWRLAARRVHHSQRVLGACLRRMKARLGTPKALTATAPKLARLVSRLLQHGSAAVPQGLDADAAPSRERQVTTMAKQAKALGSTLVPLTAQGEERGPGSLRARPASQSVFHALRCPLSSGRRGRSVPSIPRQPTPPVHRGSPTAVILPRHSTPSSRKA